MTSLLYMDHGVFFFLPFSLGLCEWGLFRLDECWFRYWFEFLFALFRLLFLFELFMK